MKKWTLVDIHLLIVPWIASCTCSRTICISPISFAPIAGDVANTCMRDSCSKDVGLSLQVLSHKTTVRSTNTANVIAINKRMCSYKCFSALDDFIGCLYSPCIYVTCRKLLSIPRSTTWLQCINYVVLRCIYVQWVGAFKNSLRWACPSIVIYN